MIRKEGLISIEKVVNFKCQMHVLLSQDSKLFDLNIEINEPFINFICNAEHYYSIVFIMVELSLTVNYLLIAMIF